jgi:hypothetical protein
MKKRNLITVLFLFSLLIPSALLVDRRDQRARGNESAIRQLTSQVAVQQPDFQISFLEPNGMVFNRPRSDGNGVLLTSLGGFYGYINLTATISPVLSNGPVITISPNQTSLAISQSMIAQIMISTTLQTPVSSYSVSVRATSGALTHVATVSIAITDYVPSWTPHFIFKLWYQGLPAQGGPTVLIGNLTNSGVDWTRVVSIQVMSGFLNFTWGQGLPLAAFPGTTATSLITIEIPMTAKVGNNSLTALIDWEYRDWDIWIPGGTLRINGSIPIAASQPQPKLNIPPPGTTPSSSHFPKIEFSPSLLAGIGAYIGLAVLAMILVIRRDRSSQKGPNLPLP